MVSDFMGEIGAKIKHDICLSGRKLQRLWRWPLIPTKVNLWWLDAWLPLHYICWYPEALGYGDINPLANVWNKLWNTLWGQSCCFLEIESCFVSQAGLGPLTILPLWSLECRTRVWTTMSGFRLNVCLCAPPSLVLQSVSLVLLATCQEAWRLPTCSRPSHPFFVMWMWLYPRLWSGDVILISFQTIPGITEGFCIQRKHWHYFLPLIP